MKEVGKNRRVLVLGGTGAMGVYLVPELVAGLHSPRGFAG